MRNITAVLALMLISSIGFSQDRVLLTSGGILKGKYIGNDSTNTLLFFEMAGNKVSIPWGVIKGIKFEGDRKITRNESRREFVFEKSSYYNISANQLFYTKGNSSTVHLGFGLNVIGGYRWNNWINVGIGTGVNGWGDYTTVPIFAKYDFALNKSNATPVFIFEGGYGFNKYSGKENNSELKVKNGWNYGYGVGYQWKMESVTLVFNIMGKFQYLTEYSDNPSVPFYSSYYYPYNSLTERDRIIRRIQVGTTIEF